MEITYQPIEQQDVEKIFAYLKELILRYEDLGQIDCEKVLAWCRKKIGQQMEDYRKIFCGGSHAGYVAAHDEGDRLEIDYLYLAPAFQGKGIGTVVLRQMVAQAMKENKTPYLYVFIRNEGAVRLYRRLGFAVVQEIPNSRYIMEYRG